MKTAIITGITGQDGSYLSELLLSKNYYVIGLYRRSSTNNFERISHIKNSNFIVEEFDLTDPSTINNILKKYKPDELYNLAAQSHVGTSFKQPTTTFDINTIGVINLLEAIRNYSPNTRFYQASTSEMFGSNYSENLTLGKYQDENTSFSPRSPYGISKAASHRMVQIYRDAYNIFACNGILFNHESPRRGENFVTRKITKYIGQLINRRIPIDKKLGLGNLDSRRDWGHAKDYVVAMNFMLQTETPKDYVISTGKTFSVRDFCKIAFETAGLNYENYVIIDPEFYRPAEVDYLKGNSELAKKDLNWSISISFEDLVKDMVYSDLEKYR